jgi:hypothetical protein
MAEALVFPSIDGIELQLSDISNLGAVAGLADDRVLAEVLRLTPFDGANVYKAILGYSIGAGGLTPSRQPIVTTSGAANGSITVSPFRAIIGSRNAPNTAPSPNPAAGYQGNVLANWRDTRSAIFTGSTTALTLAIQLAANASGNPRWDLVYAAVAVDANGPSVSRRVKSITSGAVSTQAVPQFLTSTVNVSVLQGTPSGTPVLPPLPADAGGVYYIALCYVRIPNGFGSSSTIATTDIRTAGFRRAPFRDLSSGFRLEPATGNNDVDATYATNFPWVASTGPRPGPFMSNDWIGGKMVAVDIDATAGNVTLFSHPQGSVVDSSVDWRGRRFLVFSQAGPASGSKFDHDPTAKTFTIPSTPGGNAIGSYWEMASSMFADGRAVSGGATVSDLTNARNSGIASGAEVWLYTPMTGAGAGNLLVNYNLTLPAARITYWIMASEQFPNF